MPALNAVVVTMLWLAGGGPGAAQGEPALILAAELESLTPPPGAHLSVLGRFQSWVGSCLTLRRSQACFEVRRDADLPLLRDPGIREFHVQLEVRAGPEPRPGAGQRFEVIAVRRAPEPLPYFEERRPALRSISPARQRAVLAWALDWAARRRDEELAQAAAAELLAAFGRASGAGADPLRLLPWVDLGCRTLPDDPRWVEAVVLFGNRFGAERRVSNLLESRGYIADATGWRRLAEFLDEAGLAEWQGRTVTVERFQLEQHLEVWGQREQSLLRSLTSQQYQLYARQGKPRAGMHRAELIVAWGYPTEVTWLDRGERRFECWRFRGGWAFIVDGLLFSWEETTADVPHADSQSGPGS